MPKKRRSRPQTEILTRSAAISSFNARIGLRVDDPRDPEPEIDAKPWLELRGTLNEPLGDVSEVVFSVYPDPRTKVGTARPPAVASIIQVRPYVSVVGSYAPADFDRIWSLALTGQLKHTSIYFTKPHYGHALVVNLSVSNEPEE